jgi:hypothetical protein
MMRHNEKWLADLGYHGQEPHVTPVMHPDYDLEPHEIIFNAKLNATRSKIEQVNKRIKDFKVNSGIWRHNYEFYEACFYAVSKIIIQCLVYQPISR